MKIVYCAIIFFLYNVIVNADYKIGIGIADCTGPSVEINFMGYAKLGQFGCGIHLRQFSRAFIVDDGENRVAYVTVDTAMMGLGLRQEVLKRLKAKYGDVYREENVILSGTHTHGTPGGFMMDVLFDFTILGFVNETYNALAHGITQSIIRAHDNIVDGKIFVTSGELLEANINRSPYAYDQNPEEEKAKYKYNVDKEMTQVKFVRSSDGETIGVINWFAVHPTSMNNTNCLVTSDNVGYASVLLEEHLNNGTLPGKGKVVGAFASTNLGDVSPNTKGATCITTGEDCDYQHSTCDGDAKVCIAFGPGKDMFDSTRIIANKLFNKAKDLYNQKNTFEVTGPVRYIHQYVDMPKEVVEVTFANGTTANVTGCLPAMGYSFAGGTTDGPGEFDFKQGTTTDNPFWNAVRDLLFPPTDEQIACQHPKPILLNTGVATLPYQWQPQIVATQLFTIGELALIAVPGEFTTMSGRRLRDAVKSAIIESGGSENTRPILTGLSNVYTDYIATPEEYSVQRYEGGSTIFGPWTLSIYIQKYKQLAKALIKGESLDNGPEPPAFPEDLWTFVGGVNFDSPGPDKEFGQCLQQPPETAKINDTVIVKFVAGNPRNDVLHEKTFLTVEKQNGDSWELVATDASWETRFKWTKTNYVLGESEATIQWDITENVSPGVYRITHNGHHKSQDGEITAYNGATNTFVVQ